MTWYEAAQRVQEIITRPEWAVRIQAVPRVSLEEERYPLVIISPTAIRYSEEARGIVRQTIEMQVTVVAGEQELLGTAVDIASDLALQIYTGLRSGDLWLEGMPEVEVPAPVDRASTPGDVAWLTLRLGTVLIVGETP